MLRSSELAHKENHKNVRPWLCPYVVVSKMGCVSYEFKSEVGNRVARVHANRLRRINPGAVETSDPRDGVFPDSLRTLWKISGTKVQRNVDTGLDERMFKEQIGGWNSPRWTQEADLAEVVVRMYDVRQQAPKRPTTESRSVGFRDEHVETPSVVG